MKKFLVITAGVLVLGFNGSAVANIICVPLKEGDLTTLICQNNGEYELVSTGPTASTSTSTSQTTTTSTSSGNTLVSPTTTLAPQKKLLRVTDVSDRM